MNALKSLDAFPKVHDEYRVKTTSGAVVSIISLLVMLYLTVSELMFYLKPQQVDHLFVNTTRSSGLTIDFDISFHEISCHVLAVDAIDETGKSQASAIHELYKHRLTPAGERKGEPIPQKLGDTVLTEEQMKEVARQKEEREKMMKTDIGSCGNCYGAGSPGQCCNSCQDVKDAYARKGWSFQPQGIIQCSTDAFLAHLQEQFADDGGCQLYGRLELNKASGHFHIAPTSKLHQNAGHLTTINILDLIAFTFDQFNVSHTINSLSFGNHFPGIKRPLDGVRRVIEDTHGMYQYFIKVVPTKYKAYNMEEFVQSNQYTVTEYMSHLAAGSGRGLPGLYFYYEVSPIQAQIEEKRPSLIRFITSLCAIVGGAYTVMGVVDVLLGWITVFLTRDKVLHG